MAGVAEELARNRKRPLIIGRDRTGVRDFRTPMAAAGIGTRAAPLPRASHTGASLKRSRNSIEERLLRQPRGLIAESVPVTILADRSLGRVGWAAVGREQKSRSDVRIKPDVTIACSRYRGGLRKYPTKKGVAHLLRGVAEALSQIGRESALAS